MELFVYKMCTGRLLTPTCVGCLFLHVRSKTKLTSANPRIET